MRPRSCGGLSHADDALLVLNYFAFAGKPALALGVCAESHLSNISFHGHSRVCGLGTRLEASSRSAAAKLGEADIILGELSLARNSKVRRSDCYAGKQRTLLARPRRRGVWLYAYLCAS